MGTVLKAEGHSADTGAGKFQLVSMGGRVEGLACADLGARTPIGARGNFNLFIFFSLSPPFINSQKGLLQGSEFLHGLLTHQNFGNPPTYRTMLNEAEHGGNFKNYPWVSKLAKQKDEDSTP